MSLGESVLLRFLLDRWELVVAVIFAIGAIFTRRATQEHKVKMLVFEMEHLTIRLKRLENDVSLLANEHQGEKVANAVNRQKTQDLQKEMKQITERLDKIGPQIGDMHQVLVAKGRQQ